MSQVEKLENSKVKITFEITKEELEVGMEQAYKDNRKKYSVPGFRKGKTPRKIIENYYGGQVFIQDGINNCLEPAYIKVIDEHELDVVSRPEIDCDFNDDGVLVVTAEVYIKPDVELSEYKGVVYKREEVFVDEDDVNGELETQREKNARKIVVEDRAAQMDDILKIDFEGFIDGVPFEGGKAEDFELVLGSKTFIEGFEEQLVGVNLNEEVEVNVNFPQEYHEEKLQGAPAIFKVTIKKIEFNEMPELDDDFASDISDFETLAEYKDSIKAKLLDAKTEEASQIETGKILDVIIEKAKVDLPEVMVEREVDNTIDRISRDLYYQNGVEFDFYLQAIGKTIEEYREGESENARKTVMGRLVLDKIAELEDINVSEDEYDKEIDNIAARFEISREEYLKYVDESRKELMMKDLKIKKTIEFIKESAVAE